MSGAGTGFNPNFRESKELETLEEYGRFQQHIVLLEDYRRVATYVEALSKHGPGGAVVDVGSGTGVLGILALLLGYEHAFLIEPSRKMGAYALHLAKLNGVADRVTLLGCKLESLRQNLLPEQVDLVVTETLSSLLFGFGSWDALPALVTRLRRSDAIIPVRGELLACLARRDYATRGGGKAGLGFLKSLGLRIDLFERTFRSGGNVYDKHIVADDIQDGTLVPACIAAFDFLQPSPMELEGGLLPVPDSDSYTGLLAFWNVDLCGGDTPVSLASLDPTLTSWYPFYIPFIEPLQLVRDQEPYIRMLLQPIDAPYTYAFQFVTNRQELTHPLFW